MDLVIFDCFLTTFQNERAHLTEAYGKISTSKKNFSFGLDTVPIVVSILIPSFTDWSTLLKIPADLAVFSSLNLCVKDAFQLHSFRSPRGLVPDVSIVFELKTRIVRTKLKKVKKSFYVKRYYLLFGTNEEVAITYLPIGTLLYCDQFQTGNEGVQIGIRLAWNNLICC